MNPLLLASQSPRRADLLNSIRLQYDQKAVDIDETPLADESADAYLKRIVADKYAAAKQRYGNDYSHILTADTTVVCDGDIMGKPCDEAEAAAHLRKLSGRAHEVKTAICLDGDIEIVTSKVHFRTVSEDEIASYWRSGEPEGKAGSYAIQGIAAIFVESIEGSFSNIVGLPLFETAALMKQKGISICD